MEKKELIEQKKEFWINGKKVVDHYWSGNQAYFESNEFQRWPFYNEEEID